MKKSKEKKIIKGVKSAGVINYPVGDFLVRIKNAGVAGRKTVITRKTSLIVEVAKTLEKLGFLEDISIDDKYLTVQIRYHNKRPVLTDIKLISKPGLRIYISADELEKVRKPTFMVITTSKGVLTKDEAIKKRVGGEVIAEVL